MFPLGASFPISAAAKMSEKMELSEKQAEEGLVDEAQALLAEVCLPHDDGKDFVLCVFFFCFDLLRFLREIGGAVPSTAPCRHLP